MKSLTIHTLAVAVTLAVSGSPSLAASVELSTATPAEQTDTHCATKATSSAPLYALNRLDAQTLAGQEMTDEELKAVEGEGVLAGALTTAMKSIGEGIHTMARKY